MAECAWRRHATAGCYWLGTPVGFSNRKPFLLFLGYSTLLAVYGASHTLVECLGLFPSRLGLGRLPPPGEGLGAALHQLIAVAGAQGHGAYAAALCVAAALNPLAAVALSCFSAQQARLPLAWLPGPALEQACGWRAF